MRLAMRLPEKKGPNGNSAADPREEMSAEIIDFASRTSYPAVTQRKGKSDALGMVAGIAIVAVLGAVTLWGMNLARTGPAPQQQVAPPPPQAAAAPAQPAQDGMLLHRQQQRQLFGQAPHQRQQLARREIDR